MYGSTDMNVLRTTISPRWGARTSVSASSKFDGCGSPSGREASLISRLVINSNATHALDLDAIVVIDGAAAHVGVALVGRGIDVRAATDVLEPVALGGRDDARP